LQHGNLFATLHGKSSCCGIGGTVKGLVAHASLQGSERNLILTEITFFYIKQEEIKILRFAYKLL
jgi:hypothetical protein